MPPLTGPWLLLPQVKPSQAKPPRSLLQTGIAAGLPVRCRPMRFRHTSPNPETPDPLQTDRQMWWYPWPIPAGHVEFDFSSTATSLQDVKEQMSETPTGAKPVGIPTTLPAGCRGTIHTVSRTVLFRSIHSHPHSPHPYSFQHSKVVTWSFTPRQIVVISG